MCGCTIIYYKIIIITLTKLKTPNNKTNNNQLTSAISTLKELEEKNEKFFKDLFNYNKVRKQAIKGYLNRAKNLLKIANKR